MATKGAMVKATKVVGNKEGDGDGDNKDLGNCNCDKGGGR